MSPKPGRVRIIAGKWRSRIIPVPEDVELRPTTDRIRETLFNWITPKIEGARCLDTCSGSGVLAFESLSRGANKVVAIDQDRNVIQHLKEQAELFKTNELEIVHGDVLHWLSKPATQVFDIVFVDPPFASQLWTPICEALINYKWLAPDALIYLEMPAQEHLALPAALKALKQNRAGNVLYELWSY
jgi:16S rRNA (guanine966-N2)-methyltransferase